MKFYSYLRKYLPIKQKGRLSKFLIQVGIKPSCNKKHASFFSKGIIIFSVDFEMAWAFRFSKTKRQQAVELGLHEREQLPEILELFNYYRIPITWATVGHLFLCHCNRGQNNLPHPDMPRPEHFENKNWNFFNGDWYQHDPCTSMDLDPAWYAPDRIKLITDSFISHEIACHTFSHIDLTEKNCSEVLAAAELDACIKLAATKGIKLRSMVFPGGAAGNYKTLKEKGFTCYRKPMKYHIDLPVKDKHGLIAIPSSLGLDKDTYGWSKEFHIDMIEKFIQKAVMYRQICHFWFHPSMHAWYLKNVLPEVVKMTDSYRSKNKIEILTMKQVAEKYIHLTNES